MGAGPKQLNRSSWIEPGNRTRTNCLSTARAQSPQAPPPPTRSPAPSSRRFQPWTARTFHFSRQPITYQASRHPASARTSRPERETLDLNTTTPRMPSESCFQSACAHAWACRPLPHTAMLDQEEDWEMESSAFSSLVRDPETLLASASSVAPAQSRRGAGTPRSKGGRRSSEADQLSSRGFLAGDGAPRGLEVHRPRPAADRPLCCV